MEINRHNIKYNGRSDWFHIIPIGDLHLGNVGCDIDKIKELVSWIKDKDDTYWIGMGDYVDCINYTDKRFDPSTVAHPYIDNLSNCVPMQIDDVVKIFNPIKYKCLGLHRGNHEEKIRLRYHYDIMYELWKELGVPDLKDSAITRLSFSDTGGGSHRYAFDIFSCHGNMGGRLGGAKINRLESMIGMFDCDVYLMAHSHIKATETKTSLYVDRRMNLQRRKRILAVTGCYLHGYQKGSSSYLEKWNYPPTDIGVVKVMINPRKKDIHISE